jgi:hypothetical protein
MFCCRVVWKGSFVKKDYDVDKHVSTRMTKYAIKKKLANSIRTKKSWQGRGGDNWAPQKGKEKTHH